MERNKMGSHGAIPLEGGIHGATPLEGTPVMLGNDEVTPLVSDCAVVMGPGKGGGNPWEEMESGLMMGDEGTWGGCGPTPVGKGYQV